MNRHHHRLVFSAARGQPMAVSEAASSHNGSSATGDGPAGATGSHRMRSLLLAAGCALLWPAQAQIAADPAAPGSQRPTVLNAANGVPLVNITTPSAAGVSRNTYRQFDVGSQGVKPGTVVLSEEVNARLPKCFNLIAAMAARGDSGDATIESLEVGSCDERRLTMQQARDTFEPVYWAFAQRQGLTPAELVLAATLSTAVAAANCRPAMGLKATTHLAHYSMLEASKTAPGPRPTIAEGKAHLHKLAAILPPLTWSRRFALWLKP